MSRRVPSQPRPLDGLPFQLGAWAFVGALLLAGPGLCRIAIAAEPASLPADPSPQIVEASFATSQLFIGTSQFGASEAARRLPTTSALLLVEWLARPSLGTLFVFNLPLATQRTISDGKLLEEPAAPALALGLRWSAFGGEVREDTRAEVQLAVLGGRTLGSNLGDVFFPLVGARLHVAKRDGFTMFAGATWALIRDTAALLYGVGHRF